MATNFTMRTSIVRASSGKCAVASAAYQSAEKIHDEKLNRDFSYRTKEEVVHTEILLPPHAPAEYKDRERLWNAVEAAQNRINSRYARQFVIAVPNEWSREEAIERSRNFIQKAFVDKGMIADWAYHEKENNHHLHVMCTVRGMNPDGSWQAMEKKVFALDRDGRRIPVIDPTTGEQKIRERVRNGQKSVERLWERVTVQTNSWNTYQQLREWKKEWAEHCNRFLAVEDQIDFRSYEERGIDKIPQVHEGPAARYAAARGEENWRINENAERKAINAFFDRARELVNRAKLELEQLKIKIREIFYGERRSASKDGFNSGTTKSAEGLSATGIRAHSEIGASGVGDRGAAEAYRRLQEYRDRLEQLAGRVQAATSENRNLTGRESESEVTRMRHR